MPANIPNRHDTIGESSVPHAPRGIIVKGRSRRTPAEFAALAWQTHATRGLRARRLRLVLPITAILLLCGGWSVWQLSRFAGPNPHVVSNPTQIVQPALTDTAPRPPLLADKQPRDILPAHSLSPATVAPLPKNPGPLVAHSQEVQIATFHAEMAALATRLNVLQHDIQDLHARVAQCEGLAAERELLLAAKSHMDSPNVFPDAAKFSDGSYILGKTEASPTYSTRKQRHQAEYVAWQARHQHEQTAATLLVWARNLAERHQTDRALAEYVRIIQDFPDSLAAVTAKAESHLLRAM